MSLFHYHEFFSYTSPDASYIDVGFLLGKRDVIAIGCLNGNLSILDPGIDIENRYSKAVILEETLEYPILQMIAGKFISSTQRDILAILHPKYLIFYRIFEDAEYNCSIEKVREHKLTEPSYNMCKGKFGQSNEEQICIQTINCSFSVYEAEHFVFNRKISDSITPGPIAYSEDDDLLIFIHNNTLKSIKFLNLASLNKSHSLENDHLIKFKITLGDNAIDMAVNETPPAQPSILVLCKRCLFCLTVSGNIRFILRFDFIALSLKVYDYNNEAYTRFCVGTLTRNILFYKDTKLMWSSQLDFYPISIRIATFSERYRNMMTVLDRDGKCLVIYLGTEPHLFKFSVSENRFIDVDERMKEIKEYESIIKLSEVEHDEEIKNSDVMEGIDTFDVRIEIEHHGDDIRLDFTRKQQFVIKINSELDSINVYIQTEFEVSESQFKCILTTKDHMKYIDFELGTKPIRDSEVLFIGLFDNGQVLSHSIFIPLNLICRVTLPQRNASIKLSFDSKYNALPLNEIFNEFTFDNPYQAAFQPFNSEVFVSIYVAKASNRYRVQSESSEFLYLFINELNRRLSKIYDDPNLRCAVPLELFTDEICTLISKETVINERKKNLEKYTLQFRHSEMLLLNKLKNEREEPESHILMYLNYCYTQLQEELDEVLEIEKEIKKIVSNLKPLLNLFNLLMKLNGIDIIIDGTTLENTNQQYSLLFGVLLSTQKGLPLQDSYDTNTIRRLMDSLYNSEGFLTGIIEEEEEDDENEDEENKIEEQFEFSNIQSGSMKVISSE
uniref:CPSF_A domain-containing protein n=1 Tax=Parastrongyloides trichosuri TaxID=131310 RepID=A0A0N4Z6G3_PARTI